MNKDYYAFLEKLDNFYKCPQSLEVHLKAKWERHKYICVFGVGNVGRYTAKALRSYGFRVDYYCDNDSRKWGQVYDSIKCLSLEELEQIKEQTLVIICGRAYQDIFRQLSVLDYPHLDRIFINKFAVHEYLLQNTKEYIVDRVNKVLEICADEQSEKVFLRIISEWLNYESGDLGDICRYDQYFCEDILVWENNEVFIDCGAYDGDTLREFLRVREDRFKKMILFELSSKNYNRLMENISLLPENMKNKIETHNQGVSSKQEVIFYEELDEGCSTGSPGTERGSLTTIDSVCGDENVTYIKMDIEGSEMDALDGAKKCILRNKPKLAVCLYHKPQDMWEIPLYIKQMIPEYKIYLRHHTDLLNETVCYAVI